MTNEESISKKSVSVEEQLSNQNPSDKNLSDNNPLNNNPLNKSNAKKSEPDAKLDDVAIQPPRADELLDVAIIGGGMAGATAGIYSGRYLLKTAIFYKIKGGAIVDSPDVENFPGFIKISGMELMQKVLNHAKHYGALLVQETISRIEKVDLENEQIFVLHSISGKSYRARKVILATGLQRRKLGLKNEEKFLGRGVSYCATCDGFFYRDKTVAVVGGSDSAALAAMVLSKYASKIYIIYRRSQLRCEPYWRKILEEDPKIEIIYDSNPVELVGENKLEAVKLDTGKTLPLDGLFVEIGSVPALDLYNPLGVETKEGYIVVDSEMRTSVPGIYAAGDITTGSAGFKQLIVAAAEGSLAAASAHKDLKKEGRS